MTDAQLLEIGIQKRNDLIKGSWQYLFEKNCGNRFENGESYRCWVKDQVRKMGQLKTKVDSSISNNEEIPNYKETVEIKSDGTHHNDKLLKMSAEQSKDVDFLLKSHGYDNRAWELISARSNIWNIYSKIDKIQTLYSSKISVKPRANSFAIDDIKEFFTDLCVNYQSPKHEPIRYSEDGKMLELNITDLHLGKLAWVGDSNDTYNSEIAKERFFYIINDVLTRTEKYKFEKILFVWSHDFFHHETTNVTTTAGTRQDTDMRWQQLFKAGVKMLTEAIDLLSQYAPVSTCYVGSNHDKMSSYYATEYLFAWFRNNSNVEIDTDPKIRKYVEFGDCLIQMSHGHAEGKRIGELMPKEAKEAWGRTVFKEVHSGHFHSERTLTKDNGVIVRYLGSPSGTDNWHYESGYTTSIKKGESFVWDRKKGLLDIIFTTVE